MTKPDGIAALLFDKDGTLFHFARTWAPFTAAILRELADGDPDRLRAMERAIGFDTRTESFAPDSPVIAGTGAETARRLAPLCGWEPSRLERHLARRGSAVRPEPAVPLGPLMARFQAAGLRLGVATNDSHGAAMAHLRDAGVAGAFDFVAGYDSGFGSKPDPGPLLAFARHIDLPTRRIAMVGDSLHDLRAAHLAGMHAVAVLTGPATASDLRPLARAVLPDIGHLPDWLTAEERSPESDPFRAQRT